MKGRYRVALYVVTLFLVSYGAWALSGFQQ